MPPNYQTGVLYENDEEVVMPTVPDEVTKPQSRKPKLIWKNIILMGYLHLASVYGFYLLLTSAKWTTVLFAFLMYQMGGLGITAGAHRLWSHKAYKAKWPLQLILMIFNTIAFQNSVIDWARDHRVHHKYSETDADPHNSNRGFFFSHIGWLLCRKHPEVAAKGQGLDFSDLYNDPILKFQKKYYLVVMNLLCFILPTVIPVYFWGESPSNAFFLNLLRYAFTLHSTWLVNSVAHMFGSKPYEKSIKPTENSLVTMVTLGEGWHNYHHTFPWDYRSAELGKFSLNYTTTFLHFMAKIGWAYDMKIVAEEAVKSRVERTGDGSHSIWGWGDKDQAIEEREKAIMINKKDD